EASDYARVRPGDRLDLIGLAALAPGQPVECVLHHADGTHESLWLAHSYAARQLAWFRAGSALKALREEDPAPPPAASNARIANPPRTAGLLGCAVVAAAALVRLALFLREPLAQQIGVIPDDAFYYLVAARHFAQLGVWTFDGLAPASGFHLLYAYLLAALFKLAPDLASTTTFAAVDGAATALLV